MERGTGEKLTSFKLNQSKGLKYNTNRGFTHFYQPNKGHPMCVLATLPVSYEDIIVENTLNKHTKRTVHTLNSVLFSFKHVKSANQAHVL